MVILAQTGSDFSEFMRQPFISGALSLICLVGLLLVAVIGALVYVRRRKANAAALAVSVPDALTSDEMPDFDMLTSGLDMPKAPVSAPTPLIDDLPPVRTVRKGTFTLPVNDGDTTEAVEVLTILRDVMNGTLIVQMGEKAYQNVNNDPDFKERFNRLMRELAQVAKTPANMPVPTAPPPAPVQKSAPPAPPPAAPAPEADVPVIDTASSGVDVSGLRDAVLEQAEIADETPSLADLMTPAEPAKPRPAAPSLPRASGPLPGDLPGFRMDDYQDDRPKRGKKYEPRAVPEVNIAAAIEAYLQHKLRQTPEYAGRNIHIYPSPDGGVSIEVDGQYYEAVSDISDSAVRTFVAESIQEWQDRQ